MEEQEVKTHYCLICLSRNIPRLTVVRMRTDVNTIIGEPVAGCDVCDIDLHTFECLTIEGVKDFIDITEEYLERVKTLYEFNKDKG